MNEKHVEILLVEDNPNDEMLALHAFKKHNLANKLIVLKDGAEALGFLLAKEDLPLHAGSKAAKVILLDLKLPKVNGIEVLRQLKADERTKRIPVVVLTSSTEERDLQAAYDLGVNSYVSKPIKFSDFAKVIAELGMYWLMTNRRFDQ